jgi:hypothetical protein
MDEYLYKSTRKSRDYRMDVDVDGDGDDDENDASSSKDPCRCWIDALYEFPL